MRRYAIVGLLGISLLFAALPFAGAVMFQDGPDGDSRVALRVPVVSEEQNGRDEASAKGVIGDGGCPSATGQDVTQF